MYELTPREFANHAKGRAEIAKIEARSAWERTRWATFWQLRSWGTKIESPEELLAFDDERPGDDEQQRLKERAAKLFPKYI